MVSFTQAAVIPSLALLDGPYWASTTLIMVQTCIYYVQAPLFFLSGFGLSHPPLSQRHRWLEIIVNNCVIARGEVVVVEGNYGIRIQEIISRAERLRTLN